jgi:CMP-N,N'-diacetyllegionaminic acid synthase
VKVYGLVPARSGSKGLPDKNILPVGGHPLMAYSIAYGKKLGLDALLVSTDSAKYAEIGRHYGAECPYLRGEEASSDSAREEDILSDLQKNLPSYGYAMPDLWVWLKPTNPFRSVLAGIEAIQILKEDPNIESVRIVSEADIRLQQINEQGYLESIPKQWVTKYSKMPRTAFPKAYLPYNQETFRHRCWLEHGTRFMGDRIKPIICSRLTGLDVDDAEGFRLVQALIESQPRHAHVAEYLHL